MLNISNKFRILFQNKSLILFFPPKNLIVQEKTVPEKPGLKYVTHAAAGPQCMLVCGGLISYSGRTTIVPW